jgi:formylglycine-generating enzyme required for sulfatase activity
LVIVAVAGLTMVAIVIGAVAAADGDTAATAPAAAADVTVVLFSEAEGKCESDQPAEKPFTRPVCSRSRGNSPEGLCDMTGNAAEWVADWFLSERSRQGGSGKDPRGPCSGRDRCPGARAHVIKGGSWLEPELFARIHTRAPPTKPYVPWGAGFRCARSR